MVLESESSHIGLVGVDGPLRTATFPIYDAMRNVGRILWFLSVTVRRRGDSISAGKELTKDLCKLYTVIRLASKAARL